MRTWLDGGRQFRARAKLTCIMPVGRATRRLQAGLAIVITPRSKKRHPESQVNKGDGMKGSGGA